MFLLPFLTFGAWRLLGTFLVPTLPLVIVTAALVVLLAGTLVWVHSIETDNAGRAYVPARIEDGRIIPGHAAPPSSVPP